MEDLTRRRRVAYSSLEQTATESPEEVIQRVGDFIYGICERRGIRLPEDALPVQEQIAEQKQQQNSRHPIYATVGGLVMSLAVAGVNYVSTKTYVSPLEAQIFSSVVFISVFASFLPAVFYGVYLADEQRLLRDVEQYSVK